MSRKLCHAWQYHISQLDDWPFIQVDAGNFLQDCTDIHEVVKTKTKQQQLVRVIASKVNMNIVYEDTEGNAGFQIKTCERASADALSQKFRFHCASMKNAISDGWYSIHVLGTVAKGGKGISKLANIVFPQNKTKTPMIGLIFTLQDQVQLFDRSTCQ